jgi:hypothetical protein
MEYLIIVSRSDNLAQNPKMTSDSLKTLAEAEALLKTYNKKR